MDSEEEKVIRQQFINMCILHEFSTEDGITDELIEAVRLIRRRNELNNNCIMRHY